MSKHKKRIISLIIFVGIGLFCKHLLNLEIGTWILNFAACYFLIWLIYFITETTEVDKICKSMDRRFQRIEKPLGLLENDDEEIVRDKIASYRVELVLMPQWKEVLKMLASQNNQNYDIFIKEILNDDEIQSGLFFRRNTTSVRL